LLGNGLMHCNMEAPSVALHSNTPIKPVNRKKTHVLFYITDERYFNT